MIEVGLQLLLRFLEKYLFILKAASDGWRVSYKGGNKFTFYKLLANNDLWNSNEFLSKYKYDFYC